MRSLTRLGIAAIGLYRALVSPVLPRACRFAPSCSEYARQCLALHGFWRGSWLTLRRLVRCHPLHPGGYDPPPGVRQKA